MKVILQQEVPNVGKIGDILDVSDGFGRNFLIPQGKALMASTKNMKEFEHKKRLVSQKLKQEKEGASSLAVKLEQLSLTIKRKVGEQEKLFGSVTNKDIQELLVKEGFKIEKGSIVLDEPIKALGVFTVPIRLHPEVIANLKVWVVEE